MKDWRTIMKAIKVALVFCNAIVEYKLLRTYMRIKEFNNLKIRLYEKTNLQFTVIVCDTTFRGISLWR